MTAMSQAEVVERAIEAAELHGFRAEPPRRRPRRRLFWQRARAPEPMPDFLVSRGEKSAAVEVKAYTPLLGAVSQTREYADHWGAQAILCAPDASFERIPQSVREYADRVNVRMCAVSEIGETLKDLLE